MTKDAIDSIKIFAEGLQNEGFRHEANNLREYCKTLEEEIKTGQTKTFRETSNKILIHIRGLSEKLRTDPNQEPWTNEDAADYLMSIYNDIRQWQMFGDEKCYLY